MTTYKYPTSRLKAIYLNKNKSGMVKTLNNFIQVVVAIPLGLRVQPLRPGNESEYVSNSFRDYCKTTAIAQQGTAPYTPQQKKDVRKERCTIMGIIRCFFDEENLPESLRGEIAATAVNLITRLLHKAIGGGTA